MIFYMVRENVVRIVTILYSKQNDTECIIGEVFLTAFDKELTNTTIYLFLLQDYIFLDFSCIKDLQSSTSRPSIPAISQSPFSTLASGPLPLPKRELPCEQRQYPPCAMCTRERGSV